MTQRLGRPPVYGPRERITTTMAVRLVDDVRALAHSEGVSVNQVLTRLLWEGVLRERAKEAHKMPRTHDHPTWHVGDHVLLRMADAVYPADITAICDYSDTHSDGYKCQQYEATITFPHETVQGAEISHCMIIGRREATTTETPPNR